LIGELSGIKAMSRNDVKQLCEPVIGIPIATGTIQKVVDRTSTALLPAYERIGRIARRFWYNYIGETSWFKKNDLTGCGPWSTNGWPSIASTRTDPRRPSKNWSGIGTAFWSATVAYFFRSLIISLATASDEAGF
jgi:hypothetical protein